MKVTDKHLPVYDAEQFTQYYANNPKDFEELFSGSIEVKNYDSDCWEVSYKCEGHVSVLIRINDWVVPDGDFLRGYDPRLFQEFFTEKEN